MTASLLRIAAGNEQAAADLFQLLREELHRLAEAAMRKQAPNHTLQATALVNEAWMRLVQGDQVGASNRRHFLCIASKAMRSILVDHARRKKSDKRGGDALRCPLPEELMDAYANRATDLVELDDALERLTEQSPRLAQVVDLRFFGGLTIAETAQALDISDATVERDWHLARIWLRRELGA